MNVKVTWAKSVVKHTVNWDRPVVILVEGKDEVGLMSRVVHELGLDDQVQLHNMEGKDTDWRLHAELIRDDASFIEVGRAIAFIRDADDNPAGAFQSCAADLQAVVGVRPAAHAKVVPGTGSQPLRCGVFVMPDGTARGSLEELVIAALEGERLELARHYLHDAQVMTGHEYKDAEKSLILAYLAAEPRVVDGLGTACMRGQVDVSAAVFADLRQFVSDLVA